MGFKPPWPGQMSIFDLLDKVEELGLDGVHLDAAAIGPMERQHLQKVNRAAEEKNLYVEFNWGLPKPGADKRLQFELKDGIALTHQLGSDLGKLSLNLTRSRPVMASKHSPEVMVQLKQIANLITDALPLLEHHQIKLALENHTDCYASELIWLLKTIDHPLVGACVDTVNPLMVGEDPMQAIRELVPFSFTNHFRDSIIHQTRYGCRIEGCALGKGDLDLKTAYDLIKQAPNANRINIEIALNAPVDSMETALFLENDAVQESIKFCRHHLNINK